MVGAILMLGVGASVCLPVVMALSGARMHHVEHRAAAPLGSPRWHRGHSAPRAHDALVSTAPVAIHPITDGTRCEGRTALAIPKAAAIANSSRGPPRGSPTRDPALRL